MRMLSCLLGFILLLLSPRCVFAVFPEGSNLLAVPSASGIALDGSRLGDADFDLKWPRQGRLDLGPASVRGVYQRSDLDDKGSSFSAYTLFVELAASDESEGAAAVLSPRLAAGISYLSMSVESLGDDADDSVWMLRFGAGAGFRLTADLSLDVRYRYLSPLERTMRLHGKTALLDVSRHNLLVGMRLGF